MKKVLFSGLVVLAFSGCVEKYSIDSESPIVDGVSESVDEKEVVDSGIVFLNDHFLSESARKQIGIVTKYDSDYYQGGYPPKDRGACTDVIERALRENGYDLKAKIDKDMMENPGRYSESSDPNIHFRRVKNVKIFFDYHAEKLPICVRDECFKKRDWKPGDIVTFDQIPGSLWHIAIVSNKMKKRGDDDLVLVPFLIHNYGSGVVEDDMLLSWPSEITGHYRIHEAS